MATAMEELDQAIRSALDGIDGIEAISIFGSRAGTRPRPDSDLDIAVLPSADLPGGRRMLQARIAVTLADLVPDGRVDVVLLDEAPELLRQRILESGRLLALREPVRFRALRLETMREHGDREPYRRLLLDALERRLTRSG